VNRPGSIHPTAIIEEGAKIGPGVAVGAYSLIGPQVEIGAGTAIGPHVVVTGRTRIGESNRIFQFASIGEEPQDMKYSGEDTELIIGDGNLIRELCTINRGTGMGGGATRVGHSNWIMACVHIAHDCQVGSHVIMANNTALAGHVTVGDHAYLAGYSLIHQFCDIGEHSFTSFGSHVNRSIPPYVTVAGEKARAKGINAEGLKRNGFSTEQIKAVRKAYRVLYRDGLPLEKAKEVLAEMAGEADVLLPVLAFLENTERSLIR
jgi:UDP-N-acetylglucosamine acyltransferase